MVHFFAATDIPAAYRGTAEAKPERKDEICTLRDPGELNRESRLVLDEELERLYLHFGDSPDLFRPQRKRELLLRRADQPRAP